MVQRTFSKIRNAELGASVTIATGESQIASIEAQIEGNYHIVVEPERRDTAPAIMLACAHLAFEQNVSLNDTVVVMPIDTYTEDSYYEKILGVDEAVQAETGDIVLLGAIPTFPSEKYGYIVPETLEGSPRKVMCFIEKPEKALAQKLITQGALWNCGVFGFKLSYLIGILAQYNATTDFRELREQYASLPQNSFDYEIVEKTTSIAVVPCTAEWKDLGTWSTLSEEMADACSGRVVFDEKTCHNVHIINEMGLPMIVTGLHDAVVIATPDGILVSGKKESASIKDLVTEAAESRPMYESRRWGEYRVIDWDAFLDGSKTLTKELIIKAGRQLSYQRHQRRSEVWTVVSGEGEMVLDGRVLPMEPGIVIKIDARQKHAVRAFKDMHVIEIQLGDILVEKDIERFGNFWE